MLRLQIEAQKLRFGTAITEASRRLQSSQRLPFLFVLLFLSNP